MGSCPSNDTRLEAKPEFHSGMRKGWVRPKKGVMAFSQYLYLNFGGLKWFEILFSGQWSIIYVKCFNWGPSSLAECCDWWPKSLVLGSFIRVSRPLNALGELTAYTRLPSWGRWGSLPLSPRTPSPRSRPAGKTQPHYFLGDVRHMSSQIRLWSVVWDVVAPYSKAGFEL